MPLGQVRAEVEGSTGAVVKRAEVVMVGRVEVVPTEEERAEEEKVEAERVEAAKVAEREAVEKVVAMGVGMVHAVCLAGMSSRSIDS